MKLAILTEGVFKTSLYGMQVWQKLARYVSEYDAGELMTKYADAIKQEERDGTPIDVVVKHLVQQSAKQQDQQKTADTKRDIAETERLAADIRSGSRPRPSYLPRSTPQLNHEIDGILKAAPFK